MKETTSSANMLTRGVDGEVCTVGALYITEYGALSMRRKGDNNWRYAFALRRHNRQTIKGINLIIKRKQSYMRNYEACNSSNTNKEEAKAIIMTYQIFQCHCQHVIKLKRALHHLYKSWLSIYNNNHLGKPSIFHTISNWNFSSPRQYQ